MKASPTRQMKGKTPCLALIATLLTIGIVNLNAATLRHHYTLDANGNDQLGVTNLTAMGDSVSFPSSGGKAGGFLRLGGSDDYLLASTGSGFSALGDYSNFRPFSMSFWVRQTAAQAASGTIAAFGMTTNSTVTSSTVPNFNTGFEVATRESSAGLGLRVRCRDGNTGDGSGALMTGVNIADDTWHHVAVVFEAGGRAVYLDGTLVSSSSTAVAFAAGEPITKFAIGAFIRAGSPLDDLNGDIDDFQVYEGALTATEALQLYQNPGSDLNDNLPPPDTTSDVLSPDTPLADVVDTMVGATGGNGAGSTVPGPCLPQSSIYPSPDTVAAAAGGFLGGSEVVGFSQLHATGSGSSTMSYGNFLVSPRLGANTSTLEDDNNSPIANVVAHPYSYRGRLTTPGIDCAVVPTANCAIYQFDFPASSDARLYFDVARKLNSSTALTNGSVNVDLANGTISGGGTFDGNWNPAAYNVYFYAKLDTTPTSGGTWVNNTPTDDQLTASTATRQRLGSWVRFDTTTNRTVRMKIGVSFQSVKKARAYVEGEIPAWDLAGLETSAKDRWNETLSNVHTPGISKTEARRLYTALFHSLIQPRNRTGDPSGWAADAPFWDDQYTPWDTWQTLYPLLDIVSPGSVASIVNSFGERYAHNGKAETAFIMGKDFQVGQGGDEVDRIIADAWVKGIPGIDWAKIWPLLQFNAGRRTPDYINLGFVSTDGSTNGYDSRMASASSTMAFAHGDWCAALVGAGLGHTTEAQALLARSANWRNVWDPALTGDGFSGFVHGKSRNGTFTSTAPTGNANDFYQGTCWNYSFNVFDRNAMIDLMGGRARFIQRLEFAFGQNNTSYLDFGNEVNLQAVPLLSRVARPNLAAFWANNVRQRYGANTYPGDEDSGAMASLYFFLTSGFVPAATEDAYYLHGPRIPRIEFNVGGGKKFTITAENAGGTNIYVQSATLDGQPLNAAVIRHADITAGKTLAFVMGPNPSAWATGEDFTAPTQRDIQLPVNGPWAASLGSPVISNPATDSPTWGNGADSADNTAIHSAFPEVTLDHAGSSITLTATVKLNGMTAIQTAPSARFAWGLFNANGQSGFTGWPGYLAANDTVDTSAKQSIWRKNAGNTTAYHSSTGATTLTSFSLPVPAFTDDTYHLALTLTRTTAGGLDYHAALVRASDNVLFSQFSGSDLTPATFTFNRVGLRAGDALDADSLEVSQCNVIANSVNIAPAVAISAPAEGATSSTSGTLTLSANATVNPLAFSTLSKVEFFAGATKVGEATTAPYSFDWSGMTAGAYALTAKATDGNNNSATSAAVNVMIVSPTAPIVSIATPTANQSYFAPATVSLSASASAAGATVTKVEYYSGTTKVGEATTSPFSASWTNVAAGSYTLTARATNNLGETTDSAPVSIIVTTPVLGEWTSSAGGSWASAANWSGNAIAGGSGKTADFSKLDLTSNATLTLDGGATIGNLIFGDINPSHNWTLATGTAGPLTLDVTSGTPSITVTNQTTTISAVLAGTKGLTKLGTGTLVLSATNTYSGTTTISAGTLTLSAGSYSPSSASLLTVGDATGKGVFNMNSSGTVNYTATAPSIGGLGGSSDTGAGAINQTAGILNLTSGGSTYLTFGNNNTGTSGTAYGSYNLSGGTLTITNGSGIRLGYGGMGSWVQSSGTVNCGRYFVIGGGSTSGKGVATFTGGTTTVNSTYRIHLSDNAAATGTLNIGTEAGGNASVTTLSSAGLYVMSVGGGNTALNLNSGTLTLGGPILKGNAGTSVLNLNGGTLKAGVATVNLIDSSNSLTGSVYNGGLTVDTQANTATITANLLATTGMGIYIEGGVINFSAQGSGYIGAPIVTISGGSGTGARAIANLVNGQVTGVTFTTPGQNYQPGDVLTFSFAGGGFSTAASSVTYTVQAADLVANATGGLTKAGSGTLTLSGANTYKGATNINAGTLAVTGSLGTSPVTIANGGTLSGTGTSSGALTLQSGGTLAPGVNGVGTLTVNNSVTLSGTTRMEVGKTGSTLTSDRLSGITELTYGGSLVVTKVGTDALTIGNSFTLFSAGTRSGSFANISLPTLAAGLSWDTSRLATDGSIAVANASAPTIAITAPTAGDNFASPAEVTITVNAADTDGTIAKVEFFNGSTKIGESLAAPFSFIWSNVTTGSYSLTAKVTDNSDTATTSIPVAFTVNSLPTVILTEPDAGATYNAPANIPITADAADADGTITKVEYYANGEKIGESTSSPDYETSWNNAITGSYAITAKATDSFGASTVSSPVNVTVANPDNVAPSVAIISPAAGTVAPGDISITASASDTDGTVTKVEFYNGATKLGEDTSAPYSFTWSSVTSGTYTLTAKATDNDGSVTTSSNVVINVLVPLSFTQNFDSMGTSGNAPPSGWTMWNGNSGTTNGTWTDSIPIAANGANSVTSMVAAGTPLAVNNAPTATNNNGYNAQGASSSDRVLATSPTSVAGAAIQWQVTNTSSVGFSSIRIGYDIKRYTAVSSANELPGYQLFYSLDNGASWTAVTALNPTLAGSTGILVPNTVGVTTVPATEVPLASTWAPGSALRLRWVDDNAVATSPDQIIGLDNVTLTSSGVQIGNSPTVALTAPLVSDTFVSPAAINITADASDSDGTITKVEFYNGTTKLGESTTAPYGYAWTGVAAGTYSLTARATDNNSNTTVSTAVSVTVNAAPGSGTLTRGPYLQMARPTGMTVRWRSSQVTAGRVKYGTSPDNLTETKNESAAGTEHVIDLTGLTPATTYYYSIGSAFDTLLGDATTTFTTPPVPGTAANTRVWVLGDAGTGNSNQSAVRDAFYNWTGTRTPNLVLQLGDNAYNSGLDTEFQSAVFNMYGTMLKKAPFWSCLGNHETNQATAFVDTYPYFNIYTFPTAGECGGVPSGTEHYYSFDYGNIHFISLDSMTASRATNGAMATWLTQDLASTTATWIVAFFHHPPYTKGSHNSDTETELIQMRSNILPILENGGVDLVLSGHSHSYERSYLLDGHYGLSTTFTEAMKKNAGDGRPAGSGAYIKPLTGPRDHFGTVYSVPGSSGQISGGSLNHPAHFLSLNNLGSLVLDVNGTRLDATFLRENGTTPDTFSIIKQGAADTDGDGISDAYEIANGLNRYVKDADAENDSDGLSNLLEFAFGLNPKVSDAMPVEVDVPGSLLTKRGTPVTWYQTTTNGTDFRVIFIRRKDAAEAGLIYTPQFSGDLVNWENSNVTPTVIASDGDVEAVSIRYPFFVAGKKARFFRVAVSSSH